MGTTKKTAPKKGVVDIYRQVDSITDELSKKITNAVRWQFVFFIGSNTITAVAIYLLLKNNLISVHP